MVLACRGRSAKYRTPTLADARCPPEGELRDWPGKAGSSAPSYLVWVGWAAAPGTSGTSGACRAKLRLVDHNQLVFAPAGTLMIAMSDLFTFMAVVLGLFLVPGPAVLLVVTRTAQGGRRTGILTGLGIATGDLIHTLAAAVGLSALLATSALAFAIVKFAGAAYLLYLGVRAIAARPVPKSDIRARAPALVTPARAFWQAIPAEVLNPKTALFFLAFLPQFVRADHAAPFAQFVVLGLVFVAMSAAYSTLLVLAIGPIGRTLKRVSWLAKWQGRIIGSIFIALGLKVAMQRQ